MSISKFRDFALSVIPLQHIPSWFAIMPGCLAACHNVGRLHIHPWDHTFSRRGACCGVSRAHSLVCLFGPPRHERPALQGRWTASPRAGRFSCKGLVSAPLCACASFMSLPGGDHWSLVGMQLWYPMNSRNLNTDFVILVCINARDWDRKRRRRLWHSSRCLQLLPHQHLASCAP